MSYFKSRHLLLVLALIVALALLVAIALRYRPSSPINTVMKTLPEGIDVSLEDIDYTHIENGHPKWRLVSRQVERKSVSGALGLVTPELSFFDEQGRASGTLRADRGEVSSNYKLVNLIDDVVLKHSAGYTLHTDHIDYDQSTQTATTDSHVLMVANDMELEGDGLIFYLDEERLLLNSNVKGFLAPGKMK